MILKEINSILDNVVESTTEIWDENKPSKIDTMVVGLNLGSSNLFLIYCDLTNSMYLRF